MQEKSQGTAYNVSEDLDAWAKTRVDLWTHEQRDAIEREFSRRVREAHGERIAYRGAVNG